MESEAKDIREKVSDETSGALGVAEGGKESVAAV